MTIRKRRPVPIRARALSVLSAAMLCAVAACGGSGSSKSSGGDSVNIALPGYAFSLNPQIAALAQQYNDEHPKQAPIKLTLNPTVASALDNTKFLLEASHKTSSVAAEFGITPFLDFVTLVSHDVLEPWDSYIPDDIKSDIYPSIVTESTFQGKLYSWPQIVSPMGLSYRKSMVSSAPVTWDDVLASAKQVADATGNKSRGIGFDMNTWRSLIPVSVSYGGADVFKSDGYLDFTNPNVAKALTTLHDMAASSPQDIYTKGGDVTLYKTGKVPMLLKYIDAAWTAAQAFGTSDMEFAPLPRPTASGPQQTVGWSTGFALFHYATDSQKKIATDFITFLTKSETYQKGWLTSAEPSVYQSWNKKFLEGGTASWLQGNVDMLKNMIRIPPTLSFIQVNTAVVPELQKALRGEVSVADALKNAQAAADAVVKKNNG